MSRRKNDVPGTRFESTHPEGFIVRSPRKSGTPVAGTFRVAPCCPLTWVCKAGVSAICVLSHLSTPRPILPFLIHVVTCHLPIYTPLCLTASSCPRITCVSVTHPSMIHVGNHPWATNPLIRPLPLAHLPAVPTYPAIYPFTHMSTHPPAQRTTPLSILPSTIH